MTRTAGIGRGIEYASNGAARDLAATGSGGAAAAHGIVAEAGAGAGRIARAPAADAVRSVAG
jgi:hypothetical protein